VETFLEELPSAAYCNQISLARLLMHFELKLDKHPVASRNPGSRCLYNGLVQNLPMHSLLVADEVSRESLQLMTAIHDECDGLTLCEWLSQGYGCTCCHVIFKVLFWRFSLQSHRCNVRRSSVDRKMVRNLGVLGREFLIVKKA
jgi:hypothetical protein